MLICAILTWGSDLLIRPVESVKWVHGMKNKLNRNDVDFIIYDSGYLTPLAFDNFTQEISESEQTELFGNEGKKRHRGWDREDTK